MLKSVISPHKNSQGSFNRQSDHSSSKHSAKFAEKGDRVGVLQSSEDKRTSSPYMKFKFAPNDNDNISNNKSVTKSDPNLSQRSDYNTGRSNDRIFWSKEKIIEVREKLKEVGNIINKKTDDKFYELEHAISQGEEDTVVEIMLDPIFKIFWGKETEKRNILVTMLLAHQPDMLMKVLEDKYYQFDELYCFRYIRQMLNNKGAHDVKQVETATTVLTNIINCNLYDKKLHKLLAWFLGNIGSYEAFRLLIGKHGDYEEDKAKFNNFEGNQDIEDYSTNPNNFTIALQDCLKFHLEDLAMYYFNNFLASWFCLIKK
jgi:hypothetical protein